MVHKVVNNADAGDADTYGGDDVDNITNSLNLGGDYDYAVIKVSSTYYLKNSKEEIVDSGTDAGALFNTAIDALTTGGKIVFVGTITITTTDIIPKNLVTIKGFGDSSILSLGNSADKDVIKSYNFDALTGTNSTGGVHGVTLKDFVIDGNYTNNTSGYGLRYYGYNWKIENVTIRNCKNDGIYSEWCNSATVPSPDSMEAAYNNIKVHNCQGVNIRDRGPHDSEWNHVICYAGVGGNVVCESTANYSSGVSMTNCHFWSSNDTTVNFLIDGAAVVGSMIQAEGTHGTGGTGIKVQNGGTIRANRVHVFSNDIGMILNSQANDVEVYCYSNTTTGIEVNSSFNSIRGKIESNTGTGLLMSNGFGALQGFTIDARFKVNGTHINWNAAHTNSLVRAHIITAASETAVSGTPNLTTNTVLIYSVGAGTNYTVSTPLNRDSTDAITNKTIVAASNTITDTSAASGDFLKHNGTRFVRNVPKSLLLMHFAFQTTAAGTYYMFPFSASGSSTETLADWAIDYTVTVKRFRVTVVTNSKSGDTIFSWRDDVADVTGTTITVGSTATGEFDSGALSVDIAAGSKICGKVDCTAGGSNAINAFAVLECEVLLQ